MSHFLLTKVGVLLKSDRTLAELAALRDARNVLRDVLDFDPCRRKSVLAALPLYMGSETFATVGPRDELSSLIRWHLPIQTTKRNVSKEPMIRPGKKPTRTAVAGKGLHSWAIVASASDPAEAPEAVGVEVADAELVTPVAMLRVGAAVLATVLATALPVAEGLVITQRLCALHLYPGGQQFVPHFAS